MKRERTTEEYIILSISGTSALCIAPFFFIRAFYADWSIALLDLFVVLSTASLFFYVYSTSKILLARWVLAMLCIGIVLSTIALKGAQQIVWLYPGIICIFFLLKPNQSLIITTTMIGLLGVFLWEQLSYISIVQYVFSTLITLLFSYAFADRMIRQQTLLKELSIKEPLTGAGNRRAMEEKLLETTGQNNPQNPSIILIDLDEFKKVNDQYGQSIGDTILRDFVEVVIQILTPEDHLYRFGGEEFVIISHIRNQENTAKLAEQLRRSIEKHSFEQNLRITISLVIAEYKPDETGFEWLGRADKAMYQAKGAGRNLCCIAA
ncbi:GGDEF domain-containing protein [uncultured Paraglaciecola sp.]|uniref:GGDEF domain-containing protein n=1 Tax=uncultured Paraglaciecola sp. TaxID=1765024 RepID=UPI0025EE2BED|nr:GGDEF domain-containing protein [uncultured Paraglaciecola sp.]